MNTTRDISYFIFRLMAREITYNNFEISLVVFMPNITTNRAITYTNFLAIYLRLSDVKMLRCQSFGALFLS